MDLILRQAMVASRGYVDSNLQMDALYLILHKGEAL
jgi:hypothetical protein